MAKLKVNPKSYAEAAEYLAGRSSVKIGHNTWLETYHEGIAVRLYRTHIVLFSQDGQITLHTGGYRTVITKQRLNQFIKGFVRQTAYQWFWVYEGTCTIFTEGLNVA